MSDAGKILIEVAEFLEAKAKEAEASAKDGHWTILKSLYSAEAEEFRANAVKAREALKLLKSGVML